MFTLYSIVDRCDCEHLKIWYLTCFLNPFLKLIELLAIFQVKNESMARFLANKVPLKLKNFAHTRKSVGALSRADRPDGANLFYHPLSFPGWLGIFFTF